MYSTVHHVSKTFIPFLSLLSAPYIIQRRKEEKTFVPFPALVLFFPFACSFPSSPLGLLAIQSPAASSCDGTTGHLQAGRDSLFLRHLSNQVGCVSAFLDLNARTKAEGKLVFPPPARASDLILCRGSFHCPVNSGECRLGPKERSRTNNSQAVLRRRASLSKRGKKEQIHVT